MVWLVGIDDAEKIQGANGHTHPHQEAAGASTNDRVVVVVEGAGEAREKSGAAANRWSVQTLSVNVIWQTRATRRRRHSATKPKC